MRRLGIPGWPHRTRATMRRIWQGVQVCYAIASLPAQQYCTRALHAVLMHHPPNALVPDPCMGEPTACHLTTLLSTAHPPPSRCAITVQRFSHLFTAAEREYVRAELESVLQNPQGARSGRLRRQAPRAAWWPTDPMPLFLFSECSALPDPSKVQNVSPAPPAVQNQALGRDGED